MKPGAERTRGNKTNGSKHLEPSKAVARSAISNGQRLLEGIDGRSLIARRYRDVSAAIASDLGGSDVLTEAQLQLIRSAAGLVVLRERLDAKALNGKRVDHATYCRVTNSLRRLLSTIGLERRARDITPDRTSEIIEYARGVS